VYFHSFIFSVFSFFHFQCIFNLSAVRKRTPSTRDCVYIQGSFCLLHEFDIPQRTRKKQLGESQWCSIHFLFISHFMSLSLLYEREKREEHFHMICGMRNVKTQISVYHSTNRMSMYVLSCFQLFIPDPTLLQVVALLLKEGGRKEGGRKNMTVDRSIWDGVRYRWFVEWGMWKRK